MIIDIYSEKTGITQKMKSILYPDSGSRFEDAAILHNAVYFSTAVRAYSARLILQQSLGVNVSELSFLTIKAFEEFMTSTEDLIGWFFALKEWKPGSVENSLLKLLDKIQVGKKNKYEEDRAVSLLANMNEV